MTAVVTGSRGFIGRHLVQQLSRDAGPVVGVSRGHSPPDPVPGVRYHRAAEDDPGSLLPADLTGEPFVLVHLSWDTSRPARFEPHASHTSWLARVVDHWTGRGLSAVVAAGTAEEFGQRAGQIRDDDPPAGRVSAYGWGKTAARELLRAWSGATSRPAVWLRPFVVYGPGQGGAMAVPSAVRSAVAGTPADFTDGLQRRDFVYVDDAAAAFRAAVRTLPPGFTAANVGTGEGTPVRWILESIGRLLGARAQFRFGAIPRRPGEPEVQVAAPGRAAEVLGWAPRVGWREGVRMLAEVTTGGRRWTA